MALLPGTRVGPYEVGAAIGEGGMGEVYRARDTKLDRTVALKVLPAAFTNDPDRVARFEREARVLAALNHPNIAQIYGLESGAIAMELVDGPTLDAIIRQGALPLDRALPIARQVADALEAAHEQGIVHRDLKPANIKVRDDGTVKVLDFGLAKALDSTSGSSPDAATLTSPAMTGIGVILGTAAYMAPEQAKGRAVDKRADIWAFGVVLSEMLTGQSLFARATVTETLAAVIRDKPQLDQLPADTPPSIRQLVARCLEQDPRQRLRDIGEARILLSTPPEAAPAAGEGRAARRNSMPIALGALAIAAIAGAAGWLLKPANAPPLRRFDLPASIAAATDLALAPDGTRVAYFAHAHLYVRALDALDSQDLGLVSPGGSQPFWSRDSRTIAFISEAAIHTIPAGGGPEFVVCRIPASGRIMGAAWLANGTIVFSVWRDSLYSVPATGGAPGVMLAVNPETEIDFHSVNALPDDRLIVSTHQRKSDSDVTELVDGKRRVVISADPTIRGLAYAAPGRLLFLRTGPNAGLWTVPFKRGPIDLSKATLIQRGVSNADVADDGTLIFALPAPSKVSLVWVDRSGAETAIPGSAVEPVPSSALALSPDERRAAFVAEVGQDDNLLVRDLASGADTQVSSNKSTEKAWARMGNPAWFPSGDQLLVSVGDIEAMRIVAYRSDIAGEPREMTKGLVPAFLSDGRTLLFVVDDRGQFHLRRASLDADGRVGPAQPVFHGDREPDVNTYSISPDSRVIAYAARQDDGKSAVFIASLADTTARFLVANGSSAPRFSRDGREIFYVQGMIDDRGQPRGVFTVVSVTTAPAIRLGAPTALFDNTKPDAPRLTDYAVAADGRRFLMRKPVATGPAEASRLVVVQNWPALIAANK
jgi:predicted Ser/Thr protein kinase